MNSINGTNRTKTVRLDDAHRRELSEFAEGIAADHFPTQRVEPVTLAERKEIPVAFNQYGESFDGTLEYRDGRFCIFVNLDRVEAKQSPRARFTVAHELGHYFIDEHRNALRSGLSVGVHVVGRCS